MNLNEYQQAAATTAIYPKSSGVTYNIVGLCGEVGEIAGKYSKCIRDGIIVDRDDFKKELGDVLWFVAMLAKEFNFSLEEIGLRNLEKLQSRKDRNCLTGDGDNR
jgi:NTP pyrophosphatase (non-canonical NTP hydrolase)